MTTVKAMMAVLSRFDPKAIISGYENLHIVVHDQIQLEDEIDGVDTEEDFNDT